MFRTLIGKGHPEFSTNRQQDAVEFLLHLITTVEVRLEINERLVDERLVDERLVDERLVDGL